ncbi:glycosyltransferase [Flavitalea antarctica]
MRLINIVDSVSDLNFGVWNAAIINAGLLKLHGIKSELWHPGSHNGHSRDENVTFIQIIDGSLNSLRNLIAERALTPAEDIIVTSGVWQYPTKWGAALKKMGFRWIFVPQGMLEPWPLRHKWLKKKIYFHFVEKWLIQKADMIRAVSAPEQENLQKIFPRSRVIFIPNGVLTGRQTNKEFLPSGVVRFLFLSRLHSKKNVFGLVKAWIISKLNNNPGFQLLIAGPDQGELQKIQPYINQSNNISYVGTVSGKAKKDIFDLCDFYILPSFSEGLPSSMLEAMATGLIPIISSGCNFPDLKIHNIGLEVTTDVDDIRRGIEDAACWNAARISDSSRKAKKLIEEKYSIGAVTSMQIDLFNKELKLAKT